MFSLSELSDKKLHFIGIGGAGMSGLARIALTHSAAVSGSDEKDSSVLAQQVLGQRVVQPHLHSQGGGHRWSSRVVRPGRLDPRSYPNLRDCPPHM